jgi:hypothetical protein
MCYPCRTTCPARYFLSSECPAASVHDHTNCIRCPPAPRNGVLRYAVLPTDLEVPETQAEKCAVQCTPPAELTMVLGDRGQTRAACLMADEDAAETDVSVRVERLDKAGWSLKTST